MKKVFSLMAALAVMVTLSACGNKESEACVPEVIENEVIKENIINKDVIKEVEVPVEVEGEFDYIQQYTPGTYFKATDADENGVVTFATVVVDKYGRIAGVHIDNTTTTHKYKIDEENDKLYVYVPGVKDVIPNAYRLVDLSKDLPTIEDGFTVEDLIEGYPAHDAKILTLKDVKTNETKQITDNGKGWSGSMNKLADRIVLDQTTYGINLYESGKDLMTNSVEGVTHPVGKEIELVQSILDEAKLAKDAVLATKPTSKVGLYNTGAFFTVGDPQVGRNGVVYNTAFVVVDEFGEIAGIRIDETYNGLTKWVLGDSYGMKGASAISKEWYEQVEELENAILRNQTIDGLKYVDSSTNEISVDKVVARDTNKKTEFKDEAKVSNVSGTSISVNGLVEVVKEALSGKIKVELQPGTYYNTDDKGNIMSVTIAKVDKNGKLDPTGTAKIVGMTLDTLETRDQAYITIDGTDYELYTYDKGSLDLSLDEVRTKTLIYKDGDSYRYAENEVSQDRKAAKVGDVVKFDYAGYDELATVMPVKALSTKQSLKDRYGMATTEGKLEWYEQANAYTDAFIGKDTAYVLNMIDSEHQDTVSGVTIKVADYNALLVDTLLKATDEDNVSKNIVTDQASLDALNNKLNNFVLANGSYYATSDIPNADGGFYTLTVVVYDNKVISVMLDETIEVDGKLTTKASLGNDYKVDKDFNKTEKDGVAYEKQIAQVLAKNLKEGIEDLEGSKKLLDRFSYELDSELEERADFLKAESDIYSWNDAFEKVLLVSLKDRVSEVMNNVADNVEKQIKDGFVVASSPSDSGKLTVEIPNLKLDKPVDTRNAVEFDLEEVSKDIRVSDDDTNFYITADAKDIVTSTTSKVRFTVEYDDYEPIVREVEVKVQSVKDYKQAALDSKNADGKEANKTLANLTSNELVSGADIELSAQYYETKDAAIKPLVNLNTKLGDNDTNPEINWMIKSLNNVVLSMNVPAATGSKFTSAINGVQYNGSKFLLPEDTSGNTLTIDVQNKVIFKVAKADTLVQDIQLQNGTIINGHEYVDIATITSQDKAKAIELVNNYLMELFTTNGATLKATVVDNKNIVKGEVVVRAFFDDYDQDARDGKLGTYQKGEAYRDFTMDVYTAKQAFKLAKERTSVGNILDTVTNEGQVIDLTVDSDLKLNNTTIAWSAKVGDKDIETWVKLLDKDGKNPIAIYIEGANKVTLKEDGKLYDVTVVDANEVNNKPAYYSSVATSENSSFNPTTGDLLDGFRFVETRNAKDVATDRQLEVKINNANSARVNIEALYKVGGSPIIEGREEDSKLVDEFIVARATTAQFEDRMDKAIKDYFADASHNFLLKPFMSKDEVDKVIEKLPVAVDGVITPEGSENAVNVSFKWYYADGREIKPGHLEANPGEMPSLGKVLNSQLGELKSGDTEETKISCVATYEVEGVEKDVTVTFNTTVYQN